MATNTINNTSISFNPFLFNIPSHIWLGPSDIVKTEIKAVLQNILCAAHGCTACATCIAIDQEQYYAIQWIQPNPTYTRDMFESLFEKLSFTLNDHEKFFFILEDIHDMPAVCANSLLKSLEEPPPGYYFFLGASQLDAILPTIRSRSIIHKVYKEKNIPAAHPLFDYFIDMKKHDPLGFIKELEQSEIHEQESSILLNALFAYWIQEAQNALQKNNTHLYNQSLYVIATISDAFAKLPMPGSSKIFWKNLYLKVKMFFSK